MSKKHFEAAAKHIRNLHECAKAQRSAGLPADHLESRAAGAEDVCLEIFREANPRFDSVRFIEACRPQ